MKCKPSETVTTADLSVSGAETSRKLPRPGGMPASMIRSENEIYCLKCKTVEHSDPRLGPSNST